MRGFGKGITEGAEGHKARSHQYDGHKALDNNRNRKGAEGIVQWFQFGQRISGILGMEPLKH
jgi:hypothetical protein